MRHVYKRYLRNAFGKKTFQFVKEIHQDLVKHGIKEGNIGNREVFKKKIADESNRREKRDTKGYFLE